MQQIFFRIPDPTGFFPGGLPLFAYGFMLFVAFLTGIWMMNRQAAKLGIPITKDQVQDLVIVLFIVGLLGARLTYMLQFGVPLSQFPRIWDGGIVLYGGIFGGVVAFIAFHTLVLKKRGIGLWQLGDLAAPTLALGIAIGRVGCLLNGCCYGNPSCPECDGITFPLMTAPARDELVMGKSEKTTLGRVTKRDPMQTSIGFTVVPESIGDPRSRIDAVEPDSAAARAGLKPGDKIRKLEYFGSERENAQLLMLSVLEADRPAMQEKLAPFGMVTPLPSGLLLTVTDPDKFEPSYVLAMASNEGRTVTRRDAFQAALDDWPRGVKSIGFVVERDGVSIHVPPFTPRTIPLYPTQIYESVSMVLLCGLLLAFFPFRQHHGQVFVVFMVGYACHRYLNEILRTEPVEGLSMTLSQNFSVLVLLAAGVCELVLRRTQPRLGKSVAPSA